MKKQTPVVKGRGWKTAITRKALSVPMREIKKRFLPQALSDYRVLDFGCGRGQDADTLGFEKFDPNWGPDTVEGKFDFITCNYVLNVLPKEERGVVLERISSLLKPKGIAYISVRNDVAVDTETQWSVDLELPLVFKNSSCKIYKMEVK